MINSSICTLRLLGAPRVEGLSGVLAGPVAQRHRLALLALLATAPHSVMSRDRLIGLLWPETTSEKARHLLNVAVHSIRTALGERTLLSEGDALRLDRELLAVDVVEFERLIANGDDRSAASIYGGTFCEGLVIPDSVEFDHWQEREVARLERSYHSVLERLAEGAARQGDYGESIRIWERRLACTPADGRIALRLMQTLAESGNRAGALQVASLHARVLREDFAVQVDPRITALVQDLERAIESQMGSDRGAPTDVSDRKPALPERRRTPPRAEPPRREAVVRRSTARIAAWLGAVTVVGVVSASILLARPTRSSHAVAPGAYDAWLKARQHLERRTAADLEACVRYADEAINVDPNFASAYGVKAACHLNGAAHGPLSSAASLDLAAEAARRAIALDPGHPGAHIVKAWTAAARDRDWVEAERLLKRAITLDEASYYARTDYAYLLACLGRHEEAIAQAREGAERNPVLPFVIANEARVLYLARRYDEAVAKARHAIALDSTHFLAYERLAFALSAQRKDAEAIEMMARAVALAPGDQRLKGALGYMLARGGRRAEARSILASLMRGRERSVAPSGTATALLQAGLGDTSEAVRWLERAERERDVEMMQLMTWPVWDPLRTDPRFDELLARMNFPAPKS
ncbi:MAG TPA: BTAD domain-containing putative transcriptional regulator [Gemmatimonadaceae bacterium]|nr:BTAD domain-containing putative transcriptional regulator [Gemmatimonadaceae bacterium]